MSRPYVVASARREDVARLPAIELAAARLLAGHAPEAVLRETNVDVLLEAQQHGRLWTASVDGTVVGFAHVELIEAGAAHLEEIDVDPRHGRRGIGTALVSRVCGWAEHQGFSAVTLCTFRDVPWNMPFYARHGFAVVTDADVTPALRAVVEDERRRGLDPARRVVMRRLIRDHRAVKFL